MYLCVSLACIGPRARTSHLPQSMQQIQTVLKHDDPNHLSPSLAQGRELALLVGYVSIVVQVVQALALFGCRSYVGRLFSTEPRLVCNARPLHSLPLRCTRHRFPVADCPVADCPGADCHGTGRPNRRYSAAVGRCLLCDRWLPVCALRYAAPFTVPFHCPLSPPSSPPFTAVLLSVQGWLRVWESSELLHRCDSFLDLATACSLPFRDRPRPVHCLSSTTSLPVHRLSLTSSLPFLDLVTAFPRPRHCLSSTSSPPFLDLVTAFRWWRWRTGRSVYQARQ